MKTMRSAALRAKPISWVTHHRHAFMRESDHHVEHFKLTISGRGGGGLVEQHDLGAHGERAGDGHTLLLATGES